MPRKKRWRHWLYAATLLVAGSAGSAQAETFTVTNNNDSGAGSLRQAILDAEATGGADVINIANNLGTITLTTGGLFISDSVTINGGVGNSVSGNDAYRPFFVNAGTVTISNLTIQNGLAKGGDGGNGSYSSGGGGMGAGGAVFARSGANVTLDTVTLVGNRAVGGNGGVANNETYITGGGGGGLG
ncbi:MAG: hypothetical protein C0478_00005, partial [Planctomyces sp.]|nr:hypothetical protein [Planctomyces sp.]